MFFIPLVFNPWAEDMFVIPKISFFMVALGITGIFFIKDFLTDKKILLFNRSVVLGMVAWLFSMTVSTLFSIAPLESFWGSAERQQGLLAWLLYGAFFFFCVQALKPLSIQRRLFHLLMGLGVVLSLHAIAQQFGWDFLPLQDLSEVSNRSVATIGQPNMLGQWLIFPIVIAAGYFFRSTNNALGKSFAETSFQQKWRYGISLGIMFFGLLTTANRATMLALMISGLLMIAYHGFLKKARWFLVTFGIALVILASFGGVRSLHSRTVLIRDSLPLVLQNPVFGSGPETFYQTFQTVATKDLYLTETLFNIADRVHNEFLQIFLDQGIFGFSLLVVFIVFLIKIFIQKKLNTIESKIAWASLVAFLLSLQFSFALAEHWIVFLALLSILMHEIFPFRVWKISGFQKTAAVAVAGFLTIAIFARAVTITLSDVFFSKGIRLFMASDPAGKEAFQTALDLDPWNRAHLYFGIPFLMEGVSPPPIEAIEQYSSQLRRLTNQGVHANLVDAAIAAKKKNFVEADRQFSMAATKAPNWPVVWQEWGNVSYEQQDHSKAIEYFERFVDLAPPFWQWKTSLSERSFQDREKYRIFRKSHQLFYDALEKLVVSYEKTGFWQKAAELRKYL